MRPFTALLLLLLICLDASAQRAGSFHERVRKFVVHDAPRIRVDNVRVIDGTGAAAREGQSIVIEAGKIARIGSIEALKEEAADVVIDGRGRSVLPGLVMVHEHLVFLDPLADAPSYASEPFASPKLYLAHGATTIRTAGTVSGIEDLRVAAQIREGQFVGPEIRVMTVSPAAVDTGFVPGRTTAMVERGAATTPLKRVVQADEVAQAVMAAVTHLTSSTGIVIPVDGGKLVG